MQQTTFNDAVHSDPASPAQLVAVKTALNAAQAQIIPWDTPARHGLLHWNFPLEQCQTAAGLVTLTGTIYLVKIRPLDDILCTSINLYVGTAVSVPTTSDNVVGLYSSDGQRQLGISADQGTAWGSTGLVASALGAAVQLVATTIYYIAILSVGTAAAKFAGSLAAPAICAAGHSAAGYPFAVNGTSQTALPATFTMGSNSLTGAFPIWVGIS